MEHMTIVRVREGLHACELAPYDKDALNAPAVHCALAVVYAWTGQTDLALNMLDEAASRPAGGGDVAQLTYGDLRFNPVWDSLRTSPRFTALTEKLAPKTSR